MGILYGREIYDQDSCILAVDAANADSYSGSGNVWRDLSPYKNHMQQTDSNRMPTFNTASGLSYFQFGSTYQHFKSTNYTGLSNDEDFALTAIVGIEENERRNFSGIVTCGLERSNSAFARFALLSYNYQSSSYGQGLGTDIWAPSGRRTTNGNSMPLNTPTIAAWVIPKWLDTKTTTKIFMNGSEVSTFSYGGSNVSTTATTNPFHWYFGNWQLSRTDMDFQGKIYFVYLFNTALSDEMIYKYYLRLKSKVGH